jgi:hypothetical protein
MANSNSIISPETKAILRETILNAVMRGTRADLTRLNRLVERLRFGFGYTYSDLCSLFSLWGVDADQFEELMYSLDGLGAEIN